jgi:hypothetical protein
MSQDFGMAYLTGAQTALAATNAIPFTSANFVNTPSGSNLSLVNSGNATTPFAGIRIAATGFYQVSFGVAISSTTLTNIQLEVNGVSVPYGVLNLTAAAQSMTSMTVIVPITTNPSTLTLIVSAATTLGPTAGTVTGYMTVVKLQ